MTEKTNKLANVKEGDWIWTIQGGWEKVAGIENVTSYPVRTEDDSYKLDGKRYEEDLFPSAYLFNPFDKADLPPVSFKDGEIAMVSTEMVDGWEPVRVVGHFTATGKGCKRYRKLTNEEKGDFS